MEQHFRYENIHFGYLHCTLLDDDYESAFCPTFWDNPYENFLQHSHHPDPKNTWRKPKKQLEQELGLKFPIQIKQMEDNAERLGIRYQDFHGCTIFYPTANYYTIHKEYKYYLENNLRFIVPQVIDTSFFHQFIDPTKLTLPQDMLDAIHRGQATFMFYQSHEGYFTQTKMFEWVDKFAKHFGFTKDNLKFLTSNLIVKEVLEKAEQKLGRKLNFEPIPDNYFEHFPWWMEVTKYDTAGRTYHYEKFHQSLEYNRRNLKHTHFLSLNRRPAPHRVLLKAMFMANPDLSNNKISLGNHPNVIDSLANHLIESTDFSLFKYGEEVSNLIRKMNSMAPFEVDRGDFSTNFATEINIPLMNECFVSIITETDYIPDTVFISEKMWKPVYTASPFIVIGNKGTLKKLRELGYKTFDKWWDESYDDIQHMPERLARMEKVFEEIASWDVDKLWQVTQEMEEVLIHNFNTFMDSTRLKSINRWMSDLSEGNDFEKLHNHPKVIQRERTTPKKNLI